MKGIPESTEGLQLEKIYGSREELEEELRRLAHELDRRVRELGCVAAISRLMAHSGQSLDEMCRQAVERIPDAWQHAALACGTS